MLTGDAPAILITVLSAGGILAKIQYEQFIIPAGNTMGTGNGIWMTFFSLVGNGFTGCCPKDNLHCGQ